MRLLLALLVTAAAGEPNCTKVPDHYEALRISPDATPKQIRDAARKERVRFLPAKSQKVDDAIEVLEDPKKKRAYDRRRKYCRLPWYSQEWKKKKREVKRKVSQYSPYTYILVIYIADPAALWASLVAAWAWIAGLPAQVQALAAAHPWISAAIVAIVAVGIALFVL